MVGGFGAFSVEVGFCFEDIGEDVLCQWFLVFNILLIRYFLSERGNVRGEGVYFDGDGDDRVFVSVVSVREFCAFEFCVNPTM